MTSDVIIVSLFQVKNIQAELPLGKPKCGWGGRRERAGRKPIGRTAKVRHGRRPFHERRLPVHVTTRVARGIPNLRRRALARAIGNTIFRAPRGRAATFRVVHFSVQADHLHLIVEAGSARSLGRGLQGLLTWIARRVNRACGRAGQVFPERYHARELETPTEVRRAVGYVIHNWKKHVRGAQGIDEWSSGPWFYGVVEPDRPSPVRRPVTWLLRGGWKRAGDLPSSWRPGGGSDEDAWEPAAPVG